MKITILGSGTSSGVPALGCDCAVCCSDDPRNKRRRVSIIVEQGDTRLIVDTSPDLRAQLLDAGVTHLDAVLYTHGHADHVHGIDDLRSINFTMGREVDVWGSEPIMDTIQERFGYAFLPMKGFVWSRPSLIANYFEHGEEFTVGDISVIPFDQHHGRSLSSGFRFGDVAYSTDVNKFPEHSFNTLKGVKLWIIDCVGFQEHPTHSHLEMTLEWIERVKPERAILTHMSHQFDHEALSAQLPDGVEPGYDGLEVELNIV